MTSQHSSHEIDRQFQVYFSKKHLWADTILFLISIPPFLVMPFTYSFSSTLWAMWSSVLLYLCTCVAAVFLQRDAYIEHREITILLLQVLFNTFGLLYVPLVLEYAAMATVQTPKATHALHVAKQIVIASTGTVASTLNGILFPLRSTNSLYCCTLAILYYITANSTICKLGLAPHVVPMWVVRLLDQRFGLGESRATEVTCKCMLNFATVLFGGVLVMVSNAAHERACLREFERSRGVAGGQMRLFRWPTSQEELLPLELVVHVALLVVFCPAMWNRLCRMGLRGDHSF